MSEIKLPFTQTVGIIIAAIILIVTLGGYVLFFKSQSRLNAQIKAAEELKQKYSQMDSTLNEMKTKNDNAYEDMKKVLDELQVSKTKYQDCQQKYDALESRCDALQRQGTTSPAAETTTTTTTTTGQDHPAKDLNTPAPAATPPATPASPSTETGTGTTPPPSGGATQ